MYNLKDILKLLSFLAMPFVVFICFIKGTEFLLDTIGQKGLIAIFVALFVGVFLYRLFGKGPLALEAAEVETLAGLFKLIFLCVFFCMALWRIKTLGLNVYIPSGIAGIILIFYAAYKMEKLEIKETLAKWSGHPDIKENERIFSKDRSKKESPDKKIDFLDKDVFL